MILDRIFQEVFFISPNENSFTHERYDSWGDDILETAIVEGDETGIRIWFKLKKEEIK